MMQGRFFYYLVSFLVLSCAVVSSIYPNNKKEKQISPTIIRLNGNLNPSSGNSKPLNWLPLKVGNISRFWTIEDIIPVHDIYYSVKSQLVTAKAIYNGKTYYSMNGFFNFPNGTWIRYDNVSEKIFIYYQGNEHLFMDFLKNDGDTFLQFRWGGNQYYYDEVEVKERTLIIFGDTLLFKGFYHDDTWFSDGEYYFAPNYGRVYQNEWGVWYPNSPFFKATDNWLIEFFFVDNDLDTVYYKHNSVPDILFNPITFTDSNKLEQNFYILHPYSVESASSPLRKFGYSYLQNVYLESFYSNSIDTIFNQNHNIEPLTEIQFKLYFNIDTSLYLSGYTLYYRLVVIDKALFPDTFYFPNDTFIKLYWRDSTTSILNEEIIFKKFQLKQNYPNPFNPSTVISYQLPVSGDVTLKVYDVLGREVATLIDEYKEAGSYEVEFKSSVGNGQLANGVYFYQLKSGDYLETKKMILLK